MSREGINRRQFLTLPLALVLAPLSSVTAETQSRRGGYAVEVGLLYGTLTLRMAGAIDEAVDRVARTYEVKISGEGTAVANRVESIGRRLNGVWVPSHTQSWFQVRGRESRSEVRYNWDTRAVQYHFRGETFFLRRVRQVDDTLKIPDGVRVDDVISAMLNYADDLWKPDADGRYRTHVVRRRRSDSERPDDVEANARAELAPLDMTVVRDDATGKPIGVFDMTRFSSWARRDHPARMVFDTNRRPELLTSPLILGTSMTVRFRDP
jgi:hypothetical protein